MSIGDTHVYWLFATHSAVVSPYYQVGRGVYLTQQTVHSRHNHHAAPHDGNSQRRCLRDLGLVMHLESLTSQEAARVIPRHECGACSNELDETMCDSSEARIAW